MGVPFTHNYLTATQTDTQPCIPVSPDTLHVPTKFQP